MRLVPRIRPAGFDLKRQIDGNDEAEAVLELPAHIFRNGERPAAVKDRHIKGRGPSIEEGEQVESDHDQTLRPARCSKTMNEDLNGHGWRGMEARPRAPYKIPRLLVRLPEGCAG